MKLQTQQGPLEFGLQTVYQAISRSTNHPVLTGIMLTAQEDIVHLSATDLEKSVECVVAADVEMPGALVLPGQQLRDIVSKIPEGEISLTAPEDRYQAVITWRNSEFVLNGYPPDQFPNLPTADESSAFSISSGVLQDELTKTAFVASTDESMPIISGVNLDFSEGVMQTIGTDGYRVAVYETEVPGHTPESLELVLPKKSTQDLLRMLNQVDAVDSVEISLSENHVFFEMSNGVKFATVTLEGKYPDVLTMVPKPQDYATHMTFDRADFAGACERTALLAEEHQGGARPIHLHIKPDKLILKGRSPELGEAYDEIQGQLEGEELDILFQAKYLMEGVSNMDTDQITFSFTDQENAAQMQAVGSEEYLYVVLPMKARD